MSSIASGLLRNPNMNFNQEDLKLGKAGCLAEPWGHNIRDEQWLCGPRPNWWWTGKPPADCPGFVNGHLTSLPLPCLVAGSYTRQSLLDYFDNTWTLTELLFSALQGEEAFYRPPYHQLRHPMVFYYVHPAALYVNKFRLAGLLEEPTNQIYEQLFETGVDEMSWDDMSKNCESWPMIRECTEYRRIVYKRVRQVLETHPKLNGDISITCTDSEYAVPLVFEHERIHIETSSVLMRELPVSLLRRPEQWVPLHGSAIKEPTAKPVVGQDYPHNLFISIPGQVVTLGRGDQVDSFGWDNEFGSAVMSVKGFDAQQFLCTNGQYWEFVSSGAYVDEEYWTAEGWGWRVFRNVKWPTFWVPHGPQGLHDYWLRTVFEIIPMPWSCPAVVNLHESKAYCSWLAKKLNKPCRIPTESEHRCMRTAPSVTGPERDAALRLRGDQFLVAKGEAVNLNLGVSGESAVDALPPASTGVYDAMGNVWVWCEDWFCPLDGFRVNRLYDDFSTPCFDNKHNVIMGGSFISTGTMASIHARFHFRPHFFQHSGFRVIIGEGSLTARPPTTDQKGRREASVYTVKALEAEAKQLLDQAIHLHYGGRDPWAPAEAANYPQRCAQLVLDVCQRLGIPMNSALDLGCSVGGIAFHLAQSFQQVTALDLDDKLVHFANAMKADGQQDYTVIEEGQLSQTAVAHAPVSNRERVHFLVADATCLPPDLKAHNVVLAANFLDYMCSPKAVLGRMAGLKGVVEVGGVFVSLSAYSWASDFTHEGAWLGGYTVDAKEVRSLDGMKAALGDAFELVEEHNVPFCIRAHARKYEFTVCHATVWRRLH